MKLILLLAGLGVTNSALYDQRELSLQHSHTGNTIPVTCCENRARLPAALKDIDDFLKDFRSGAHHDIDPALLDVLYEVR